MLLYQMHEFSRAWMAPFTYWAEASSKMFTAPGSWLSGLPGASRAAAGYELFYRIGKDYEKPRFDIHSIELHGQQYPVIEREVLAKPFCRLLRFKRFTDDAGQIEGLKDDPTVLVVAPLSGHHSTLLRDTVRTLLRDHKVYVTDWVDARMVPEGEGPFGLDDYVGYIEEFIRTIGAADLHVISVCQPTVPVLAAVSLMAARGEATPRSLVMMGGPIDTRESPTSVNSLATQKPLLWFETNVIHTVPANYPGRGRRVYPGFLQHTGFVAMNPERHFESHWDFYQDLVKGDLDDADAHRRFYDEYNAVLDMPAEYYLDTIRVVFQEHLLPRGLWDVAGERVDPGAIRDTALMSIEGELDDISGLGQTRAAHKLCTGVAPESRVHFTVEGAGHYGIFSGRRWRDQVYPQVRDFIARHAGPATKAAKPKAPAAGLTSPAPASARASSAQASLPLEAAVVAVSAPSSAAVKAARKPLARAVAKAIVDPPRAAPRKPGGAVAGKLATKAPASPARATRAIARPGKPITANAAKPGKPATTRPGKSAASTRAKR